MATKLTKTTLYTNLDQIALALMACNDMIKRWEYWAEDTNNEDALSALANANDLRVFCDELKVLQLLLTFRKGGKTND